MLKLAILLLYGAICMLSGFLAGWYVHRDRMKPVAPTPGARKQPYSAEREAEMIIMEAMK